MHTVQCILESALFGPRVSRKRTSQSEKKSVRSFVSGSDRTRIPAPHGTARREVKLSFCFGRTEIGPKFKGRLPSLQETFDASSNIPRPYLWSVSRRRYSEVKINYFK